MKKAYIISECIVCHAITEKEALILASRHPFFTSFYSSFQTDVILKFLNPASYLERIFNPEFYHQCENVIFYISVGCGIDQ